MPDSHSEPRLSSGDVLPHYATPAPSSLPSNTQPWIQVCDEIRASLELLDGAMQEWRACAADHGDQEPETGSWRSTLAAAEADERTFEALEESPYDETWIETRWIGQSRRVA